MSVAAEPPLLLAMDLTATFASPISHVKARTNPA
jgi:hypothetical protein